MVVHKLPGDGLPVETELKHILYYCVCQIKHAHIQKRCVMCRNFHVWMFEFKCCKCCSSLDV